MPRNASGMTISATTSLPPKRTGLDGERHVDRRGEALRREVTPNHPGRSSPIPASTCARPIVATESTRRGARKKRRITSTSTTTPSTTAVASPATNATSQLAPLVTTSSTASEAGAAPRSPWAKLRIRCARYTSARPSARSALSPPSRRPARRCRPAGPTAPARARGTPPRAATRMSARRARAKSRHDGGQGDQVCARASPYIAAMGSGRRRSTCALAAAVVIVAVACAATAAVAASQAADYRDRAGGRVRRRRLPGMRASRRRRSPTPTRWRWPRASTGAVPT